MYNLYKKLKVGDEQMKEKSLGNRIFTFISLITVLIALFILYNIFKQNNFNEFVRAENIHGITKFSREKVEDDVYSYKIHSPDYNDAMIYKTINVTPNSQYRLSCMVKTEDIKTKKDISDSGACISILDSTEMSETIQGTNDWKKLSFCFNSKNREQITIGFRLGSNNDNCKGTAWFKDLKLERGYSSGDTEWNMVCFIFENLDVTINKNGQDINIKTNINQNQMLNIKENLDRTKNTLKTISNYNMTMKYNIINIQEPIRSVSYDEENGYFVASSDIYYLIEPYLKQNNYDYIYAVVNFGTIMHEEKENTIDWIGLRWNDI